MTEPAWLAVASAVVGGTGAESVATPSTSAEVQAKALRLGIPFDPAFVVGGVAGPTPATSGAIPAGTGFPATMGLPPTIAGIPTVAVIGIGVLALVLILRK